MLMIAVAFTIISTIASMLLSPFKKNVQQSSDLPHKQYHATDPDCHNAQRHHQPYHPRIFDVL
jgi:hypothetical protein